MKCIDCKSYIKHTVPFKLFEFDEETKKRDGVEFWISQTMVLYTEP